jgi:hypothetical protein
MPTLEDDMRDDISRRLDDLEKRIARLERAAEKPVITLVDTISDEVWRGDNRHERALVGQWCECCKDSLLCRAPDCPSHKPDPLGR